MCSLAARRSRRCIAVRLMQISFLLALSLSLSRVGVCVFLCACAIIASSLFVWRPSTRHCPRRPRACAVCYALVTRCWLSVVECFRHCIFAVTATTTHRMKNIVARKKKKKKK
eukprot:Opistho-1_new@84750